MRCPCLKSRGRPSASTAGFTFVEVLVSLAIVAILTGGLYALAMGALSGSGRAGAVGSETAELLALERRVRAAAGSVDLGFWLPIDAERIQSREPQELMVTSRRGDSPFELRIAADANMVVVNDGSETTRHGPFATVAVSELSPDADAVGVRIDIVVSGGRPAVIRAPFGGQPNALWPWQ